MERLNAGLIPRKAEGGLIGVPRIASAPVAASVGAGPPSDIVIHTHTHLKDREIALSVARVTSDERNRR